MSRSANVLVGKCHGRSLNVTVGKCLGRQMSRKVTKCQGRQLSGSAKVKSENVLIGNCQISKWLTNKWSANVLVGKCHGLHLSDRQMLVGKRRPANVWSANVGLPYYPALYLSSCSSDYTLFIETKHVENKSSWNPHVNLAHLQSTTTIPNFPLILHGTQ